MKIWLDDEKPPPYERRDEWHWFTEPETVIGLLKGGHVEEIALDNDLGKSIEGLDIIVGIEEMAARGIAPPYIEIITWNPVARGKMADSIRRMKQMGYKV